MSSSKNAKGFHRVLLKVSGEALMGNEPFGISMPVINSLADELVEVHRSGVQMGLVIGGGNIFRGVAGAAQGMDRASADQMGMLATVINALALQEALKNSGAEVRVLSAIEVGRMVEPFVRARALKHLERGRIIIFAAGTGNPFFTTDTAAALRALEIKADVLMKATNVDGVYDKDPQKFSDAVKFNHLTYDQVLEHDLKVMDGAAIALARDAKLPVLVFSMKERGNIIKAVHGEAIGTLVTGGEADE